MNNIQLKKDRIFEPRPYMYYKKNHTTLSNTTNNIQHHTQPIYEYFKFICILFCVKEITITIYKIIQKYMY